MWNPFLKAVEKRPTAAHGVSPGFRSQGIARSGRAMVSSPSCTKFLRPGRGPACMFVPPVTWMTIHRVFFGLPVVLCVAGCASISTDPRLVGTYEGLNAERLVFNSDASVVHAQTVAGADERVFLGYYFSRSSAPGTFHFAGPDTSRFLGTSFSVSEDFSTVTVAWSGVSKSDRLWQVTYYRKAD